MTDISLFCMVAAVILLTPGPTNTLLALAGARLGVRRALPLIPVELAGYLLAVAGWGTVVGAATARWPWLPSLLQLGCAVYLCVLALRLFRGSPTDSPVDVVVGPRRLFLATLLNPKGLLFASAVFPAAAFVDPVGYLTAACLFACVLVPAAFLWIAVGAHLLVRAGRGALLQRGVAAALMGFASFIGASALS